MNAPALTRDDYREMVWRALQCAPDIGCDEAVVDHLHRLGLTITTIDRPLAEMIDEARASQKPERNINV